MYLLAKFGGHRSYGNGDISCYINEYLRKAELTTLTLHIERFLKSIPEKMGRRIQEIAKHYALKANAINLD